VSIAVPEQSWYFPVRHEVSPEENMPAENVFAWLRDTLAGSQPKVGANIVYDIGWLGEEKVKVAGDLYDVQFAEALLSEDETVALDDLADRYLGENKVTSLLYQWCSDYYGGSLSDQRKNIYRAPPSLVGPYAQADASLPLRIMDLQFPKLHKEGMLDLFRMECDLIRLMEAMRRTGVRVDLNRAEEVMARLRMEQRLAEQKLAAIAGRAVNVNAGADLAKLFDRIGVAYPRTRKGAPSFQKVFLEALEHPVGDIIRDVRKFDKLAGTFIQSYILDSNINSRVFCQFHQLRSDDGGARSGRYSSSDPNLQNIPSRDEILAPLIRSMFVPDEGHPYWRKYDYSQIEYRFLVHYAVGPGAYEARAQYNNDPDTDYHEWTLDLVAPMAHWDIHTKELRKLRRKPVKNINFGLIFGMGVPKLTRSLGLSQKEGKDLFKAYHAGVPFAKPTMDQCSEHARDTGWIDTILGRKSRFNLWEPVRTDRTADRLPGLPYPMARRVYGENIQRAYLHKSLNRRLQGSAADMMKKAMHACWVTGVFDRIGIPKLTVHDELDFSDPGGVDDGFAEMKHIMETIIPLRIPVRADGDIGPNWGTLRPIP
jgi:DNA polymerase-1